MRVSCVSLGFLAAFLGACASLSLSENIVWFTGFPTSTWDVVEPPSACTLDVFRFGVRFPGLKYQNEDIFKWQLVAKSVQGWGNGTVVASGQFQVAVVDTDTPEEDEIALEVEKQTEEGLQCEFDPDFCVPKLTNIRLPDVNPKEDTSSLQKGHSVVLEFQQPTNRPAVASKEELSRFVQFTEYIGEELDGTWSDDGRVLEIRIANIDEHVVKPVVELMKGLLQTKIVIAANGAARDRDVVALYEGWQGLRIQPPGTYAIRIVAPGGVAFWSPDVSIVTCDASFIVLDPSRAASSSSDLTNEVLSDTLPSFAIDGVLTHGGDEGFVLPHDTIDMESPGSWSLSFWVFLTEDSTGNFRTLFFNGDGENQQRTPSAWWKPDERRLVLRLTTETNVDVGLDSAAELPLDQWIHMGFTFVDCTQTAEHESCPQNQTSDNVEGWSYSFSFFVNGGLDTDVRVHERVIPNAGPLHIGKGPWTDGMQGFTSNLKVFPVPVSAEQQRKLFYSERQFHKNFADCSEESVLKTDEEETTIQISYLAQCFNLEEKDSEGSGNSVFENADSSSAFFKTQEKAFERSLLAKNSCEPDAWDYLVEAAELGHSLSCREAGDAYLYGAREASCSASAAFEQNLIFAGKFLREAFTSRIYSTGKSLALLLEVNSSAVADERSRLDKLTTGLLHFAASSGAKDAFAMLGHRYSAMNSSDVEIAAYHYYHAAIQAANEYHQLGMQPLHEMTRLFDSFERDVTAGERGDDDELIQFQKLRADQGDAEAMTDMGDLYYWGAHGVSRDHTQAYNYFNRAAHAGNVNAQSAVAGMLLKGEGAAQDDATAIKWFEKASEKNHTRALNGLGYIHFHGTGGVEANKSLALEYFERAARNAEDGDSIFNAGYCHAMGLGTRANLSRAMEFYEVAARKFGHFDALFEMGRMWMLGVPDVVSRNSERALEYLKAASDNGQWGRLLRKGFDLYSDGEFERAVVLYHEARELGYPVAISNLAFLYDQRLLQKGNMESEKRALKYLLLANGENGDRETLVRIGDYHYYGLAGLHKDPKVALRWYSRASAEGDPVGAFNVGQMYEFGDGVEANLKRAQRYYDRSLELSVAAEGQVAIRFAMTRLAIRNWVQNTPFETLLGRENPLETRADTNTSATDSSAMFDATTNFFYSNIFMIISTTAVVCISISVWYFHSAQ